MRGTVGAIALLLNASATTPHDPGPVVATTAGLVRGSASGAGGLFKGIAYARSTAGSQRWRPPMSPEPWQGVRDATHFGATCPQPPRPGRDSKAAQSEDCLTVNIATPRLGAAARLPVLVLIHGGAYFIGSGADGFDDSARIFNERGIVVVSMNYRLGRLGFFAHPGLRAEQPATPTGNYWLMDQIAALQWVRQNIAAFGGDPAEITILGCSAGGSSVNALMASRPARGLFARASAHSGGGINNATLALAQAEEQGLAFAERAGVAGQGGDAISRLRTLAPAEIIAADPGPPNFGAIVDGALLRSEIGIAFARGDIARVPYIAGSTSDEGSIFGLMGLDEGALKRRFGIDLQAVRPVYDPKGSMPPAELLRRVQTDFIFTAGATLLAAFAARRQPAYAFHFAYLPPDKRGTIPGAAHCADMAYTFGRPTVARSRENLRIAALMRGYITNFVKRGDPNGAGLPAWPQYRGSPRRLLLVADRTGAVQDSSVAPVRHWHRQWAERTGQDLP